MRIKLWSSNLKVLTLNIFRKMSRPEYDPAGDEFGRAGTAYKVAKKYEESKKCYLRAVDCYKEVHQVFQAGRMLDNAVMVCKDANKHEDISEYATRGAMMFRTVNKPEAALSLLEKAAKIIEKSRPEDAIGLYEKAAETVSVEDRPNVAADHMGKAGRICVRLKAWDRAIPCLRAEVNYRKEGGSSPAQAVMGLLLIELMKGDRVAAEKVWRELGAWCDGEHTRAVQNIIEGYDNQDAEMVSAGLDSPAIKNLDLDFSRLARELPRPSGSGGTNQDGGEEDDGNELGGLC
ncbi:gamma-soluble NSF attachment protein isoform X2 [Eurytemora carolleeae]|uniref:gamma-soluble NSF attachment protein isoform X2 n=1 Tax=Eurytemora carolleeae TaxID=1294199 RepID=UPI000C7677B3|nr:gamma-soluble NSF attachment protein isoform X2 [Eurytemora carolleeae]|eukprot:XP_023338519.1 gamma-soluble NSF attachment protein-like isoform X2 [Eurytemora affinis]